jgi:hypothetical protein
MKNLPKKLKLELARIPNAGRVMGGGLLSLLAVPAFAADDISTGAVSAITGAGPQVTAVVVALVGVLGILIAWSLIRKAMGK